jgi:hypothetical protein
MADAKSGSPTSLAEYWQLGRSLRDLYSDYRRQHGHPVDGLELVAAALQWTHKLLETLQKNQAEISHGRPIDSTKFAKSDPEIERDFRRWVVRKIRAGEFVAIGKRHYSEIRRDVKFVWPFSAALIDLKNETQLAPDFQHSEIRVLRRAEMDSRSQRNWDRVRVGKKGRPKLESISIAIERACLAHPMLDSPAQIKRLSEKVLVEIARMREIHETEDLPSEKTIQNALRKRWQKNKSPDPTH